MSLKKYGETEYCILKHNRFECLFTLSKQGEYKEAWSFSVPNLAHTQIKSDKLTEKSARTLGEMFIKVADLLKEKDD